MAGLGNVSMYGGKGVGDRTDRAVNAAVNGAPSFTPQQKELNLGAQQGNTYAGNPEYAAQVNTYLDKAASTRMQPVVPPAPAMNNAQFTLSEDEANDNRWISFQNMYGKNPRNPKQPRPNFRDAISYGHDSGYGIDKGRLQEYLDSQWPQEVALGTQPTFAQ